MIMETLTVKQKQYLEQPKERISGSEAVVRCLLAEGVDILYGYPGVGVDSSSNQEVGCRANVARDMKAKWR